MPDDSFGELESGMAGAAAADAAGAPSYAAPEGGSPAAPPSTEETVVETGPEGSDAVEQNAPDVTETPEPEKTPPGPVPYDRFKAVNEEKKEALAKIQAFEVGAEATAEAAGRARAQAILEQIGQAHPELAPILRGEKPTPKEDIPEDPVQRELYELKNEMKAQKAWRDSKDRDDMVSNLESRAEDALEKQDVLTRNPHVRELAEQAIVQGILADKNAAPEKVVEKVAATFRAHEEAIKASYKQAKSKATSSIPAGVGAGAAAPPGQAPKKLSLDNMGDINRDFAAYLEKMA